MHKNIKVVFMGTPDFSISVLEMLINECNVVLVVTQPDKVVGRKKEIKFSPIKELAIKNNIEVFQPSKIKTDFERIKDIKPDLIVTCAYGQILPKDLLEIPRLGCINVHASILPKYRGAAPIQWSLLNGDSKTGVSLMYMDEGMDTGDIIATNSINIDTNDNVGSLHDKLSILGANLLKDNLDNIINETCNRIKQDDNKATYAPMITRDMELIDLSDKGINIINKIRAFNPWPLAYIKIDNQDIKIIEAEFKQKENTEIGKLLIDKNNFGIEVSDGIIYLKIIKPVGKKQMDIKSFINGLKK